MDEKRRATTFRTSRGTIVYVEAPEVYVAPGVEPADVTSPTELRGELGRPGSLTWFNIAKKTDLDSYFVGKVYDLVKDEVIVDIKPSDYWSLTEGIKSPVNTKWLSFLTKTCFKYPLVVCRAILPAMPEVGGWGGRDIQFGLEDDVTTKTIFRYVSTTFEGIERLQLFTQFPHRPWARLDITALLPADYKTAFHTYSIKYNRMNTEFYIDAVLVGIIVNVPVTIFGLVAGLSVAGPPYGILLGLSLNSGSGRMRIEVNGGGTELILPVTFRYDGIYNALSAVDGDPAPPRVYRLYETGTNDLLVDTTIVAAAPGEHEVATQATSHPVPIFGYQEKTLNFRASEQGTLSVEGFKQTGEWREEDTMGITQDKAKTYSIQSESPIARMVFTPNTYPCTISEAEASLR